MPKMKSEDKPTVESEQASQDETPQETPKKEGRPVKIARAAKTMLGQEAGAAGRAQQAEAMQGMLGNQRAGQMMDANLAGRPAPPAIQRQPKGGEKKAPPPITTPLPKEAARKPSGAAEFHVVATKVVVLPDKFTGKPIIEKGKRRSAKTNVSLHWDLPGAQHKDGKITSVDSVTPPVLTIQTMYGPKISPGMKSTYGKGTTPEDVKAGKTTLGFHEGSHGEYAIQYAREHILPKFEGKVGMTVAEFNRALDEYDAAMQEYKQAILEYQEKMTDCVGTKADFCQD
jgi:hypothetical protein